MTRNSALIALAALVLGAAAGFVIMDPGSTFATAWFDADYLAEPPAWGGWQAVFDASAGVGVLIAALVAGLLPRARQAWSVAAVALAGIVIAQAPVVDSLAAQAVQRYAVVALAGLALGAAAAACWHKKWAALALVSGAAIALLFALTVSQLVGQRALPRHLAEYIDLDYAFSQWLWLLGAAFVLALGAAALTGAEPGGRPAVRWRSVAAAAVVAIGGATSYAIAATEPPTWGRVVPGLLVVLLALGAAAWLLPGLEGRGLFAALAVLAGAAPVVRVLAADATMGGWGGGPSSLALALLVAGAAALLGIGTWLGSRWPITLLGFALLALVALLGIPELDGPFPMTVARVLVLALATGFVLAATRPASPTGGALGLATLFTMMAPAALVPAIMPFGWFAYTPDSGPTESMVGDPGISVTGACLALAVLVLCCAGGASEIARRRG